MAQVRNNIVIQGLSGSLGDQLVIKQSRSGRTIVSSKPVFSPNRAFSAAQKSRQDAFREATFYAQSARGNDVYVQKAKSLGVSTYNLAVADWFHAPEIQEVDLGAWSGQAGQTIRIKAVDDVQVTKVTVVITDENDTFIEQGAANQVDSLWWEYVTTATVSGGSPKVTASAQDLPGHIAEMTKAKSQGT